MAEPSPQRAYRAACPGCGAPVQFRSAQSTHAVCGYCQSTVVRQGEVLSRLGKMAELFDDHSLLQLGVTGKVPLAVLGGGDGAAVATMGFTLVGRLQYQSAAGVWTEWVALQDDGETASLSEDNGAYVYARSRRIKRELPQPADFRLGATTAIDGVTYTVTTNDDVFLRAAQGELPRLPELGKPFTWIELRAESATEAGGVLTLDYGPTLLGGPVAVSLGVTVELDKLALAGLKEESAKDEKGRQFNCPSCGAPVKVELTTTKRLTCGSCKSLIDISQGIGAEVLAAAQDEPVEPVIPLGTQGQLQGKTWQVVGFQHRMGHEPSDDEEHFGWSEYLLYNAKAGFQFLVDSEEGWSLVKPTTGVPKVSPDLESATYLGTTYRQKYRYYAETTYVAGEFYWPVERGLRTFNRDYAAGKGLLSQEEGKQEVTWSVGSQLDAAAVTAAFKLPEGKLSQGVAPGTLFDAAPSSGLSWQAKVVLVIVIILLILLIQWLSKDDCDPNVQNCASYSSSSGRSSGGSWGGYSSGGSHK